LSPLIIPPYLKIIKPNVVPNNKQRKKQPATVSE